MAEANPNPARRVEKVIVGSGHMVDAPDRPTPRFPEAKAEIVRTEIARQLERWNVGNNDLAICGGACGADILFGEECLRRGMRLRLLLAQKVDDFVRDSVRRAGDGWVRRFEALCEKAEVETLAEKEDELSIYARVNLWMIEAAQEESGGPENLRALLVWDEKPTGDGPGGTSDFAERVRVFGARVAIINPLTIR